MQGFIAPTSSTDTYPVTDPHYGLGGLRTVLNLAQRDQIPAARRVVGMLVFVQAMNKYYKLLDDLVQWEEIDLSNILTNESDPTVPMHVKQIAAGTVTGQSLKWDGVKWIAALPVSETDPTVPTHVKQIPQGSADWQFLRWNGTAWTAAQGGILQIISSTLSSDYISTGSGATAVINLPVTGVTAGTYSNPTLTVDAFGRITSISSGVLPPPTEPQAPNAVFSPSESEYGYFPPAFIGFDIIDRDYTLPVGYTITFEFSASIFILYAGMVDDDFTLYASIFPTEIASISIPLLQTLPIQILGFYSIKNIGNIGAPIFKINASIDVGGIGMYLIATDLVVSVNLEDISYLYLNVTSESGDDFFYFQQFSIDNVSITQS